MVIPDVGGDNAANLTHDFFHPFLGDSIGYVAKEDCVLCGKKKEAEECESGLNRKVEEIQFWGLQQRRPMMSKGEQALAL